MRVSSRLRSDPGVTGTMKSEVCTPGFLTSDNPPRVKSEDLVSARVSSLPSAGLRTSFLLRLLLTLGCIGKI